MNAYTLPLTDTVANGGAIALLGQNIPTLIAAALPVGLGLLAFRFGWRFVRSQVH